MQQSIYIVTNLKSAIMKKCLLLVLVCLFFVAFNVKSQSYKFNKNVYNYQLYMPQFGDPYSPALSGVASLFIPGLGQMVSGEVGRGFGFLGGSIGCGILASVGSSIFIASNSYYYSDTPSTSGLGLMLLGLGGMVVVDIWAIVDAVRVAKVNNMYIQDMRNSSRINFQIAPYIDSFALNNEVVRPIGLSLRMNF